MFATDLLAGIFGSNLKAFIAIRAGDLYAIGHGS
jgi:hypothetical protein